MEMNKNMEQSEAASSVPTVKKNESRKREVSGKDVQAIRTFLESVGIYEADALRVSIVIADGKATTESISADDRLALQPLSKQRHGQRQVDSGQHTGTSVEPCVRIAGACGGVLRQAAVGNCQQGIAFHCGERNGHQPCRVEP